MTVEKRRSGNDLAPGDRRFDLLQVIVPTARRARGRAAGAKATRWVGPTVDAVIRAHVLARIPAFVACGAAVVVMVLSWRRYAGGMFGAWLAWLGVLGVLWLMFIGLRMLANPIARVIAWYGVPRLPMRGTRKKPLVMATSTRRPTAFPLITLIGVPVSAVMGILVPLSLAAIPVAFVLWLVLDVVWAVRGLRGVALLRSTREVRVGAVDKAAVDSEHRAIGPRQLTVGRAVLWDPFGGYPRAVAVLASDPKLRATLVEAGMVPARPSSRAAAPRARIPLGEAAAVEAPPECDEDEAPVSEPLQKVRRG
jgi:hypothetical protein